LQIRHARLVIVHGLLSCLFSFNAQCAFPQSPDAAEGFHIAQQVNYVLLDVSVRDTKGNFVMGLSRGDFLVKENSRTRPISGFFAEDAPVALGLVVDTSGSMRSKRADVVMAGLSFARMSNPKDQFFVVSFNDSIVPGLPPGIAFTDKLEILKRALYYGSAEGRTALYDAVAYSLHHVESGRELRRILVVVSDGGDNASKISRADLRKMLTTSQTTIYAIGLFDPGAQSNRGLLRGITALTGGEYFEPKQPADIAQVFRKISEDVRHRYTIGFAPDEASHSEMRTIKVLVRHNDEKLRARTRTKYRVPDAGAAQSDPVGRRIPH